MVKQAICPLAELEAEGIRTRVGICLIKGAVWGLTHTAPLNYKICIQIKF